MYFKQKFGKNGEDLAEAYLKLINYKISDIFKPGYKKIITSYKILEKNFRCFRGEIDLIALTGEQIIFIEIKARHGKKYGLAAEAVTEKKLKHIYKTAEYYLITNKMEKNDVRIEFFIF